MGDGGDPVRPPPMGRPPDADLGSKVQGEAQGAGRQGRSQAMAAALQSQRMPLRPAGEPKRKKLRLAGEAEDSEIRDRFIARWRHLLELACQASKVGRQLAAAKSEEEKVLTLNPPSRASEMERSVRG